MEEVFKIHTLASGERLSDLASRFEMSEDELISFHNAHSAAAGLMWFQNFVGITKMAVPALFKSKAEREAEHQKYFPEPYFFEGFLAKEYSITEKFGGQLGDFEISWNLTVELLKTDEHYQATLRTGNFRHSEGREDDKVSSLARACVESIEPLSFNIDRQGIVISLAAPDVYEARFKAKLAELRDFYVGDISDAYFERFLEALKTPESILECYRQLPWMILLFPGMQTFHRKRPWQSRFSLFPNSFPVNMHCSAEYEHEMVESAQTFVRCKPGEPVGLQEILLGRRVEAYGTEETDIQLDLRWTTDKETHRLLNADYKVTFYWEDEEYGSRTCQLTVL